MMKKYTITGVLSILLLFQALSSKSQVTRDTITAAHEKEHMMVNRQNFERDLQEFDRYNEVLQNFEAAWIDNNFMLVRRLKDTLISYMKREIHQNAEKAERELQELGRSQSDLMFEKEAGHYDRRDAIRPGHEPEEKRELKVETNRVKEDRQDVRDDLLDLETRKDIVEKQEKILADVASYIFTKAKSSDPEALDVKEKVAVFATTMQKDIEMTRAEFDENKSEFLEEKKEVEKIRQKKK